MAIEATAPVLVLGVDGSPDSQAAIHWAQRYAEATNAVVHVVVAWGWPQSYGYPVMLDGYDPQGDAQRVVEKALAEMSLPADRLKGETREGSPGPALVDASARADLLVVGSRGHSTIPGLLLGSVSTYCVHHAAIPVTVVR